MHRIPHIAFIAAGLVSLAACGQPASSATSTPAADKAPRAIQSEAPSATPEYGAHARARLFGPHGKRIGDVMVWQGQDGALIEITAENLPAGAHGVHLHAVGSCDDIGVYKASGGHIGKDDGPHGLLHPQGAHRGDLPNIHAGADGSVRAEFFSPLIDVADLRDEDGAALIIHAGRDDWQTQPIGGAGARIACAPFKPQS